LGETTAQIAENLIAFFERETEQGRLPENLLPFELGLGEIPSAILKALALSNFRDMEIYSAVLDVGSAMDLAERGKLKGASSTGFVLFGEALEKFRRNHLDYKKLFVVRPVEIADCPEVLTRLGVIALNTALEVDIYGNVNSSHILGSHVVNGLGGAMDFSASSFLSIFLAASTSGKGNISTIVPMVTHVDHTEHMVDVIVTERGVADLRNLDPKERAEAIINNCAHPDYRPLLREYFEKACTSAGGHIPHLLEKAFSFHLKFQETKSMK
jgi:succinyl-CoA:acetate CoA-transferase